MGFARFIEGTNGLGCFSFSFLCCFLFWEEELIGRGILEAVAERRGEGGRGCGWGE